MENGLFPISFLATTSAAPDTERQDDFLKLVFFLPLFPFLPCLFRGLSPLLTKTPCAPPRSALPGRREGPHRWPPVRPGPRARSRHARRGAPATRGLWDYAEAELLGPAERGQRAGWGAGRGTPAEDGWPRLWASAVRARPPAAAAVRPGDGQPPRGCGHGRTPARFGLAGPAAAWEVHGRPQPPPAPW